MTLSDKISLVASPPSSPDIDVSARKSISNTSGKVTSSKSTTLESSVDAFAVSQQTDTDDQETCFPSQHATTPMLIVSPLPSSMTTPEHQEQLPTPSRNTTKISKSIGKAGNTLPKGRSVGSCRKKLIIPRNSCFFHDHEALEGDFPRKVVKYAHKRLDKTGISPCPCDEAMPKLRHSQIDLDALLGQGSFSSVYSISRFEPLLHDNGRDEAGTAVAQMPPGDELVVKVLRKKLISNPVMLAACAADLRKEGLLLARLQHHGVISLYAREAFGLDSFINGRHDAFFLVMGKLATTLADKLAEWRTFHRSVAGGISKVFAKQSNLSRKLELFRERLMVVRDLAEAVVYLHSQHVLHRDLKPDNIGFDSQGNLKIFDFDVARILPVETGLSGQLDPNLCFKMTKRVGSPRYMSPECARGESYNVKSDVYTFSLLIHELYSLQKPYEEIPAQFHDDMIFHRGARPHLPKSWPEPLRVLLQSAWSHRIWERPTMIELQDQFNLLVPILIADKDRKYTKFSWLTSRGGNKNNDTLPDVGLTVNDEDDVSRLAFSQSLREDYYHHDDESALRRRNYYRSMLEESRRHKSNFDLSERYQPGGVAYGASTTIGVSTNFIRSFNRSAVDSSTLSVSERNQYFP